MTANSELFWVKMGADALVDFDVSEATDYYDTDPSAEINGMRITGLSIKRED